MGWILSLLIGSQFVFADPYFSKLRFDESVPQNCEEVKIGYFGLAPEKFYIGRKGALSMGFTFEYPVERKDATVLWKYFKGLVNGSPNLDLKKKILNDPDLKRDYQIIKRNFETQDFDFQSEGEILEVLAIETLYREFPENQYFITGSIEYHEEFSPQTIGELDVFVGDRQTCTAVAVGEVKLGKRKTLTKARKQLRRFSDFLLNHDGSGLAGNYLPDNPNLGTRRAPSSKDFE